MDGHVAGAPHADVPFELALSLQVRERVAVGGIDGVSWKQIQKEDLIIERERREGGEREEKGRAG